MLLCHEIIWKLIYETHRSASPGISHASRA
jgi:hypothetical protein